MLLRGAVRQSHTRSRFPLAKIAAIPAGGGGGSRGRWTLVISVMKLHLGILAGWLLGGAGALGLDSAKPAVAERFELGMVIDDAALEKRLVAAATALIESGKGVSVKTLAGQLERRSCAARLAMGGGKKLSAAELVAQARPGVLVVAQSYLCGKCDKRHLTAASGVMLTADGAFATSYHVVNQKTNDVMLIMTGDGRIAPVTAVLAARREADVAILQAEGTGYQPLPLSTHAPPGLPVRVISHPDHNFYTLSEGVVSRQFMSSRRRGLEPVTMLAITADFAKGSSGGPVFDETGAVVGIVTSTISTYYDSNKGRNDNLQMVFKHCIPSRYLLEMVRPGEKP